MPNTQVSKTRIRVWMVEVAVLVFFMFLVVIWFSASLSDEKKHARNNERLVTLVVCRKINENSHRLNDILKTAATPQPGATQLQIDRAQQFLDLALKDYKDINCAKLAKIIQR